MPSNELFEIDDLQKLEEGVLPELSDTGLGGDQDDGLDRSSVSLEDNQRKHARYPVCSSVVCFPVLDSYEICSDSALVGMTINISQQGINMRVEGERPYVNMEMLIGIEYRNGEYRYCGGTVVSVNAKGDDSFEVGVEFRGYMHELCQSENVFPLLIRDEMQYHLPHPEPVLASLCKVGAAVATRLDSIMLCPGCRGIPTFRFGCSLCLSSNVSSSKMIHHFGCAHVDFVAEFEFENELACPKCRTRRLIVGSDYEYLDGPNTCADCGQANLEKIQIGHCLSCEYRFPAQQAIEQTVLNYRVNRLDILAFINSA